MANTTFYWSFKLCSEIIKILKIKEHLYIFFLNETIDCLLIFDLDVFEKIATSGSKSKFFGNLELTHQKTETS